MTRIASGILVLALVCAWIAVQQGWRPATLLVLGAALGGTLWQSAFSFAGAWRRTQQERRTAGIRAQLLLVGATASLFLPVLAVGEVLGQPVRGLVFPVGAALLVGAFLFGVGMQLGGGCGSGTLTACGAGAARSWLTLIGFVGGATLAAWGADLWTGWPAWTAVSLPALLGTGAALAATVAMLAVAALLAARWERSGHAALSSIRARPGAGGWSLAVGALILAGLGVLTLVVAGRPWTITAAFPLWGAKLVDAAGLDDPAFWTFWEDPTRTEALLRPVLADRTTLMDLGMLVGAFLAAALARSPRDAWGPPHAGPAAASVLGGILMGIGAVLASGCNISAFLGGIASGSLHGWVWVLAAIPGSVLGVRLRPRFGLH